MLCKVLLDRRLPDGGFAEQPGGNYRPDSTAWAILCMMASGTDPESLVSARRKLCDSQLPDGRVPLAPEYPEAYWTTSVSSLALVGAADHSDAYRRTIDFILAAGGDPLPKEPNSPIGHDTSIQGWAWIAHTHSWIEPTAMAVRALALAGRAEHQRTRDGIRLLLDRQLPAGGWNYGNTTVYGKTLNPMPATTGMVLWSLAGLVTADQIDKSLELLKEQLSRLHTPLSLGWALHGLSAWGMSTPNSQELINSCLKRQGRYSLYGTSQLGPLLTAAALAKSPGVPDV